MAVPKEVSFPACLLVLGMFVIANAVELGDDIKVCTMECGNFAYGICPRSEGSPICTNCCSGYKGCNYYSANGTFICEGRSDPRKTNICTQHCDPRVAYSKCPRSGRNTIIKHTGCTTCCTGYKGCYYFGHDGKFVCEGQSSEPRACTLECDPKVAYMTCPSSGSTKLTRICVNCCTARVQGCKLYGHDEFLLCTGDPRNYLSFTR